MARGARGAFAKKFFLPFKAEVGRFVLILLRWVMADHELSKNKNNFVGWVNILILAK